MFFPFIGIFGEIVTVHYPYFLTKTWAKKNKTNAATIQVTEKTYLHTKTIINTQTSTPPTPCPTHPFSGPHTNKNIRVKSITFI